MQTSALFKEAKRLWSLGLAIHYLHPNSKRPVESGWTTGPRKDWNYLKETYAQGLNLGVRLGTPSKIGEGYLAVVDIDVKSTEERHRTEALGAARALLLGMECPTVRSGRGNGSRHYYCLTVDPFKTWNPAKSDEMVKVYMPSKKPSKKELETLTEAEIAGGYRISPAWEISLYSDGRQVVLPPSIHPDSGQPYQWVKTLVDVGSLPLIDFKRTVVEEPGGKAPLQKSPTGVTSEGFEVEPVDISWLAISDKIKNGILYGDGDVKDRSAFLLPASKALISAGLTQNEILSVLTDPETFLGACAYDHAKTSSRKVAANWVWKYTLEKTWREMSPEVAFAGVPLPEGVTASVEDAAAAAFEIESDADWRDGLDKSKDGRYKNNLHNCKTIFMNACGTPAVVGRNEFAAREYYFNDVPWYSKKGDEVLDIDVIRFKVFCVERYAVEFSKTIVEDVLSYAADRNRFNPVQAWLKTLKWDGVNRIDTWLKDYAGAIGPEPYLSGVSRKILCAMVKRVMEPGCKFDQILILEGNQGAGKSTLLRRLASDEWFSDAPLNIGNKDTILTMQAKWIVEIGELSSLNKAEIETFKSFVAQQTDRIRSPYGKRMEDYPRQGVLIGTTNNDEYLRDLTGNRRFWSVKTEGKINFDGITEIREQLFAEALAFYNLGEPLWLEDPEAEAQAISEQALRLAGDEWTSTVSDIINGETFPQDGFEMREVAKKMDQFGAHRLAPSDVHRIARCLKLLGYEKRRGTVGDRKMLWWPGKNAVTRGHVRAPESRAQ